MTTEVAQEAAELLDALAPRYGHFADLVDDGFCLVRIIWSEDHEPLDYEYLEVNRAFAEQAGMADVVGRTAREVTPHIEQFWIDTYAGVAGTGQTLRFERQARSTGKWFYMTAQRVGEPSEHQVAIFFRDITQAKLAEARLRESEALYRGVLSNMGEAFVLFDGEFNVVEVNDRTLELVSLTREELIGHNHWTRFPGTYDSELGQMYRRALSERASGNLEFVYRYPDGRSRWYDIRAYPVADGLAVFFQDISARRQQAAEAALAAERLQLALDAGAIIGTWVWAIAEDHCVADERFALTFGMEPEACQKGMPLGAFFGSIHPDDHQAAKAAMAEAVRQGGAYRCQYRVRHRDGGYRWVEASGRVQLDAGGRPVRFPGVLLDIEERRRAEVERDRATALLTTFVDAVPGVVYAKDRDGRLLVGNRGLCEVMGLSQEDFIGRTDGEVFPDRAQAEAIMATDQRIMEGGVPEQLEELARFADGREAVWWSSKAPLFDERGEVIGIVGSSVDITERKRMENALKLSEQRTALAMEVAQLGTWVWDIGSGAVAADARARELCGLPHEEVDLTLDDVSRKIHPEDWPRVQDALLAALEPGSSGTYAEEFRWLHDEGRVVWTSSRGQVLFDPPGSGTPLTMIGSVTDVTDRRQMVESLQAADRRKDEFLAMLAHELRNPLAPISTAAALLTNPGTPASVVSRASQIISRQVTHITELVDDLLDVSRVTRGLVELDRHTLDLKSAVRAAVEQVRPIIEARGHTLATRISTRALWVDGDATRLTQVVANLLNNAAKYTPNGGNLHLEVTSSRGTASIVVRDDGIGISPDLLPHVFELFSQGQRSADRSQGGLGIGLALVRSIVALHGGQVIASSAGLGRGSVFTVSLPLVDAQEAISLTAPPAHASKALETSLRIVLVDDNTDASETLGALLASLGHEVATFDAPGELLAAQPPIQADVFILDIGLPGMTGYELAQILRAQACTATATLFALSGYGQAQDRQASQAAGFDRHFVKPISPDALVQALGEVSTVLQARRMPSL